MSRRRNWAGAQHLLAQVVALPRVGASARVKHMPVRTRPAEKSENGRNSLWNPTPVSHTDGDDIVSLAAVRHRPARPYLFLPAKAQMLSVLNEMNDDPLEIDVEREEQFVKLLLRSEREIFKFILTLVPHLADAEVDTRLR